jgi:hypothetical protein
MAASRVAHSVTVIKPGRRSVVPTSARWEGNRRFAVTLMLARFGWYSCSELCQVLVG